ncbi:MAG TPA: PadR family transcriptional regulator [Acidobacteriota bacterium]
MSGDDLKLLQGTLDVLVLKALDAGPMHGYGVAQWIRETTEEALQVEEGALYTALHRMERRGLLASRWGISDNNRRAKFYRLTAKGQKQLVNRTRIWTSYADAVFKVLGERR